MFAMFFPSWAPNQVTEREINNSAQESRLDSHPYWCAAKQAKKGHGDLGLRFPPFIFPRRLISLPSTAQRESPRVGSQAN